MQRLYLVASQRRCRVDKFSWRKTRKEQPFLSPLRPTGSIGDRIRYFLDGLPPVVAPVALTVIGGVALIGLFSIMSSGGPNAAAYTEAPTKSFEEVPVEQTSAFAPMPQTDTIEAAIENASELMGSDPRETGSILQAVPQHETFVPSVPVAETEDEIARLEAMQQSQISSLVEAQAQDDERQSNLRAAVASAAVNMRAAPRDDAEVLLVVPATAALEAEPDCDSWCAVSYDGRTGFIFKDFINYR